MINPNKTFDNILTQSEACLSDISSWVSHIVLKINQDKAELIVLSTKQSKNNFSNLHLTKLL